MPNQPRPDNTHRSVRVEDQLWADAAVACEQLGTTRGAVMREALEHAVRAAQEQLAGRRSKRRKPVG